MSYGKITNKSRILRGILLPGANTPSSAPGNQKLLSPRAKTAPNAPGKTQLGLVFPVRGSIVVIADRKQGVKREGPPPQQGTFQKKPGFPVRNAVKMPPFLAGSERYFSIRCVGPNRTSKLNPASIHDHFYWEENIIGHNISVLGTA